jgi:hypothetical protein
LHTHTKPALTLLPSGCTELLPADFVAGRKRIAEAAEPTPTHLAAQHLAFTEIHDKSNLRQGKVTFPKGNPSRRSQQKKSLFSFAAWWLAATPG